MALFRKRPPVVSPPVGDGYSVLDAQLTVHGDVETDGTLRIDGRLHGSIRRAGVVILGVGAAVHGEIVAGEVIVGGTVEGDIRAAQRVELQPTATVTGDVETGAILMHEGAVLRGRLCVRPEEAAAQHRRRPVAVTPSLRLTAVSGTPGATAPAGDAAAAGRRA